MIRTSEKIESIAKSLVLFQQECPVVAFDSMNPFLKNKYASLTNIISTTKRHLAVNNLSVLQFVTTEGLVTRILHASGEWIEGTTPMLVVGEEKGKSSAQVLGSIITYLRRYAYSAALGIVSDEDKDGQMPEKEATQKTDKVIERAEELGIVKTQLAMQKTTDDLTKYWNQNAQWHKDNQIKELFTARRLAIENKKPA